MVTCHTYSTGLGRLRPYSHCHHSSLGVHVSLVSPSCRITFLHSHHMAPTHSRVWVSSLSQGSAVECPPRRTNSQPFTSGLHSSTGSVLSRSTVTVSIIDACYQSSNDHRYQLFPSGSPRVLCKCPVGLFHLLRHIFLVVKHRYLVSP